MIISACYLGARAKLDNLQLEITQVMDERDALKINITNLEMINVEVMQERDELLQRIEELKNSFEGAAITLGSYGISLDANNMMESAMSLLNILISRTPWWAMMAIKWLFV